MCARMFGKPINTKTQYSTHLINTNLHLIDTGQALNFNCAFAMVLMLRSCITWLKQTRVALVLPLDYHVDFHKLCGVTIALFASIHTIMHLINFRE